MDGRGQLRRRLADLGDELRLTTDVVVSALERNRRVQLGVVVALAVVAAYLVTKVPGSGSPVAQLLTPD